MALKKTRLTGIISISGSGGTGVGILTGGRSSTPVGIASTCYVKSVVAHNPTATPTTIQLFFEASTTPASSSPSSARQFYRQSLDAFETQIFETNYPIVFAPNDTLTAVVGVGSTANFMVLGDTEVVS